MLREVTMETVTCVCLLVIPTWLEAQDTSSRPLHWLPLFLLPLKSSRRLAKWSAVAGLELDLPHPHQEPAGNCCFEPEEDGKLAAKDVVIATAFLFALPGVSSRLLCS